MGELRRETEHAFDLSICQHLRRGQEAHGMASQDRWTACDRASEPMTEHVAVDERQRQPDRRFCVDSSGEITLGCYTDDKDATEAWDFRNIYRRGAVRAIWL